MISTTNPRHLRNGRHFSSFSRRGELFEIHPYAFPFWGLRLMAL
jgi:hypothetical protein